MIGWLVLVMLLILFLICFLRAVRNKAPVPAERPACPVGQKQLDEYAEQFGKLLRIETLSRREDEDLSAFDKYHQQIDKLFPLCTKKLEKHELNGTLLYRWKGRNDAMMPILFMGHQDVVPAPAEGWSHGPFSGDYENGILWGRGTVDDKCNLFTQMSAIEQLLKEGFVPACDIWLEYSCNEEISGNGAAEAVKWLQKHGLRFACVIDEGGAVLETGGLMGIRQPIAAVGITEKGYFNCKVTWKGKGGHSSTPSRKYSLSVLADYIKDINDHQPFKREMTPEVRKMIEGLSPLLPLKYRFFTANLWLFRNLLVKILSGGNPLIGAIFGTTCAFTMAKGSEEENVLPSEAYVVANLRTGFCQDVKESAAVMKKYADKYGLKTEIYDAREASPVTSTDSLEWKYLEKVCHKIYPDAYIMPYVMTGGTDCRHFTAVSDNCIRFCPMRMTMKQLSGMHGIDENVNIEAVGEAVEFYKEFITGYQPSEKQ